MSFCHPHWQTRNPGQHYLTTAKSKELHDLLEPSLASLGYELVQVRLLSGGRPTLQVYAEPLSGAPMRMDDCSTMPVRCTPADSSASASMLVRGVPYDSPYR